MRSILFLMPLLALAVPTPQNLLLFSCPEFHEVKVISDISLPAGARVGTGEQLTLLSTAATGCFYSLIWEGEEAIAKMIPKGFSPGRVAQDSRGSRLRISIDDDLGTKARLQWEREVHAVQQTGDHLFSGEDGINQEDEENNRWIIMKSRFSEPRSIRETYLWKKYVGDGPYLAEDLPGSGCKVFMTSVFKAIATNAAFYASTKGAERFDLTLDDVVFNNLKSRDTAELSAQIVEWARWTPTSRDRYEVYQNAIISLGVANPIEDVNMGGEKVQGICSHTTPNRHTLSANIESANGVSSWPDEGLSNSSIDEYFVSRFYFWFLSLIQGVIASPSRQDSHAGIV